VRPGVGRTTNRVQDVLGRGHRVRLFTGHDLAIDQDRKLAPVAVYDLHVQARFVPQSCRQTGGVIADAASNRAFPDRYLLHRRRSFLQNGR
jgi:hypothetical protein